MILVVDDYPDTCRVLQRLLAKRGYFVAFATNARDAMFIADTVKPNLIILDANMPDRSGLEVMQDLRHKPQLTDVPILFYSASADANLVSCAMSAGAVDWIVKGRDSWEYLLGKIREHYPSQPPDQNQH